MNATSLRFDHVAVPVHDAQAAYDLFAGTLGLPLMAAYGGDDWDGAEWLMMLFGLSDGGRVALCALAGARQIAQTATDLPHFALATGNAAQLEAWEKKLTAAGFETRREDHGEQLSVYFEDRSGLTWEITTARTESTQDPDALTVVKDWIATHRTRRA